ncbi:MAG: Lsr2 family protein [Pseudonocardia sp.]|nr:Lsr2 family protein [Pseudonocardia sp.]
MARVESVQLVDDLDGGVADETVSFSFEGAQWEIDLTDAHAAQLREALAPFVGAARRPSGGSSQVRTSPNRTSPDQPAPNRTSPTRTSPTRTSADQPTSSQPSPPPSTPRASATTRRQNAEIRQWAVANGFELSGRGRIPNSVVEAYDSRSDTGASEPDQNEPAAPAPEPAREPEKQATSGPVDLSGLFKEASAV